MEHAVTRSPTRHAADDVRLSAVLELIRESFGYMDGRIDPPSSMHRLERADVDAQCGTGEVWSIGDPIEACVFLTPREASLYVGKLAVAEHARRGGLARTLVALAEERARQLGKRYLELQTRVELVENHRAFAALGFVKSGEGAHPGYDRATFLRMTKRVGAFESRTDDREPRRDEPDLHYTDPLLAEVYDATCGWSDDFDLYLSLATRPAMRVLDLGCGTGSLCDAFAARGHAVTGLDPSAAMLDVARRKAHAADVRWVEAFAQDLPVDGRFDLVTMTGHAFQTLLLDEDIGSLFERVARHLSADGVFAFESRNPAVDWRAEWDGRHEVHASAHGDVRCSIRVTEVAGETLSFEQTYAFEHETRVSASTLRFASDERIASLLEANGLGMARLHGDWNGGPFVRERSREMIVEAVPLRRRLR